MGVPFGRYEILAKLAEGGMGDIYLAALRGPGGFEKQVALKLLRGDPDEDPQHVALFLDEARISAGLSHPNISHVYELGTEQGRLFIAMEYLEGRTLAQVRDRALGRGVRFPPALAAWVVARAAEGLAHAHEKKGREGETLGIVHRDVTPHNVMLTWDGQVKVVDFGIALARDRLSKTRTGTVRGKLAYIAPEVMEGGAADARADVFALGVILHELLAGRPLFAGDSDLATMKNVLRTHVPPLQVAELPAEVADAAGLALVRDPNARLPSARELFRRIDASLTPTGAQVGDEALASFLGSLFSEQERRSPAQNAGGFDPLQLAVLPPRGSVAPETSDLTTPVRLRDDVAPSASPSQQASAQAPAPLPRNRSWVARSGFAVAATVLLAASIWAARGLGDAAAPSPERDEARSTALPKAAPHPQQAPVTDEQASGGDITKAAPAGQRVPAPVSPTPHTTNAARTVPEGATPVEEGEAETAGASKDTSESKPARVAKRTTQRTRRERPSRDAAAAPRQSDSPTAPAGRLTLDTTPWTHVFLGDRKLGTTPLVEVALPPGRHRLHAVNKEARVDRVVEVEIQSGRTTSQRMSF